MGAHARPCSKLLCVYDLNRTEGWLGNKRSDNMEV
jgi:hypothetical protein